MKPAVATASLACGLALAACQPLPPSLSDREFLSVAWKAYKDVYIHQAGYVLDIERNRGEVTSEAQAYALLRAAWMGDQETFARVFAWTERTLLRPDGLYAWRWTPEGKGTLLDPNTATDADQDMAFALVLAFHQFQNLEYLDRAKTLLKAIRTETGIDLPGGWFPSAGNWAVGERIVNLSYFAPYAYPYFDRIDPEGRWLDALETGYGLLSRTLSVANAKLPPDFMTVSVEGEPGWLPQTSTLSRNFSFDAVRILWRVALDCRLHRRARACGVPGGVPALVELMEPSGRLFTEYDRTGAPLTDRESATFYACVLPALQDRDPDLANAVRQERLSLRILMPLIRRRDRYYDLNWIWFGLALADGWIVERTPSVDAVAGR